MRLLLGFERTFSNADKLWIEIRMIRISGFWTRDTDGCISVNPQSVFY